MLKLKKYNLSNNLPLMICTCMFWTLKRVHVYVTQYMVEKITFLYFVVEMGPNLFSGHCIGSIFYHFEKPKLIFKVKAILSYSCYWLMQYCSRLYNEAVQSLQVIMENLDVCVGKLAKIYSFQYMLSLFWD